VVAVGGEPIRTKEAADVAWVRPADVDGFDIHRAIRLCLTQVLSGAEPQVQ
jgi:hypothetical protein